MENIIFDGFVNNFAVNMSKKLSVEDIIQYWQGLGEEVTEEDITCLKCPEKDTCEYAFDPYNVFGTCVKTQSGS